MKLNKEYIIPFVGLKQGKHIYEFDIKDSFFDIFDYSELKETAVLATLELEKKSTHLELLFDIKGTVLLTCDLSNEEYKQPLKGHFEMVVKFGENYNNDNEELLILSHGAYELDISQFLFDLIVLAIPNKRVHPGIIDGTLQSEVLEKLKSLSPETTNIENKANKVDPRWDKLKGLI